MPRKPGRSMQRRTRISINRTKRRQNIVAKANDILQPVKQEVDEAVNNIDGVKQELQNDINDAINSIDDLNTVIRGGSDKTLQELEDRINNLENLQP